MAYTNDNSSIFNSTQPLQNADLDSLDVAREKQEKLYTSLVGAAFDSIQWLKLFNEYIKDYKRYYYSVVSNTILTKQTDDEVSSALLNINTVIHKVKIENSFDDNHEIKEADLAKVPIPVSDKHYRLLLKLQDHCNLAYAQKTVYQQTENSIKQMATDSIKQKIGEYEKDITTQLITLVSMFTALSFVIFGGISVLDNLLQNIRTLLLIKTLLIADLWLICMSNLFILFTKFICLLTGKCENLKWKALVFLINLILLLVLGAILFAGYKIYGKSFIN